MLYRLYHPIQIPVVSQARHRGSGVLLFAISPLEYNRTPPLCSHKTTDVDPPSPSETSTTLTSHSTPLSCEPCV